MSIADKITRLQAAKEHIAEAIVAKGGAVVSGDGFEEFSADIAEIPEGIPLTTEFTISEGTLSAISTQLGDVVINIPDGVTTIGYNACSGNNIVNVVNMPNSVTIIEDGQSSTHGPIGAFNNCTQLKTCSLSSNLLTIGRYAFNECSNLVAINIPDTVTSIGVSAFQGCKSLSEIIIPEGVETLREYTFAYCQALSNVVLPSSITSIEQRVFDGCFSLTDIYYTGTQAQWEQITIGTNAIPSGATIHYEYTPE